MLLRARYEVSGTEREAMLVRLCYALTCGTELGYSATVRWYYQVARSYEEREAALQDENQVCYVSPHISAVVATYRPRDNVLYPLKCTAACVLTARIMLPGPTAGP
eukprot:1491663-Rhodomonas_salina.1